MQGRRRSVWRSPGLRRLGPAALALAVAAGAPGALPAGAAASVRPAPPAAGSRVVNGCDPLASVLGFCLSTRPHLVCCSAAGTSWSGIYVGERVMIRGAVPLAKSGRPLWSAVRVTSPAGATTVLAVDARGGFSGSVAFPVQGQYRLALASGGPSGTFEVPYRVTVPAASRLSVLFPSAARRWTGLTVLGAPAGAVSTWRVRAVDAAGHPAAGVRLAGTRITTDAKGFATVRFDASGGRAYTLARIYGSLFVQTYSTLTVQDGHLVGVLGAAAGAIPVVSRQGAVLVDAAAFLRVGLAALWPDASASLDAASGRLALTSRQAHAEVTLESAAGRLRFAYAGGASGPVAPVVVGRLRPLWLHGRVYLSLADAARVANALAWAQPLPGQEGMLFSSYVSP